MAKKTKPAAAKADKPKTTLADVMALVRKAKAEQAERRKIAAMEKLAAAMQAQAATPTTIGASGTYKELSRPGPKKRIMEVLGLDSPKTFDVWAKGRLHKLSTDLVTRFDVICVEDLNLRGMAKNHSLARSLHDASIGAVIRMIEEKAERYGKTVVKIDRWFPSSKTCSDCGYLVEKLPLSVREWSCPECGTIHDRDANAAVNILAAGHAVTAHGDGVRAVRSTERKANCPRSANRQGVQHA